MSAVFVLKRLSSDSKLFKIVSMRILASVISHRAPAGVFLNHDLKRETIMLPENELAFLPASSNESPSFAVPSCSSAIPDLALVLSHGLFANTNDHSDEAYYQITENIQIGFSGKGTCLDLGQRMSVCLLRQDGVYGAVM